MTVFCCGDHHRSESDDKAAIMLGRKTKRTRAALGIPCVDLSLDRAKVSQIIVKACEEFGFFKVVNHGVSKQVVSSMEEECIDFFDRPVSEKQNAGPPNPFGYGCKNIGFHGDKGELEYLLMEANPVSVQRRSAVISQRPHHWSCTVNDYIAAVRELACDILDLAEEGLQQQRSDSLVFSQLLRDVHSDSCLRINRYSDAIPLHSHNSRHTHEHVYNCNTTTQSHGAVGFGEHSDPQMLTILRSNDVPGLQICSPDGVWIPVSPDPDHLCVFVGDAFQALTNGRFRSVRHRVLLANSGKPRISIIYFGAPALDAPIDPLPHLVSTHNPRLYRAFTWAEFKKAVYASRLADHRLQLFHYSTASASATYSFN